MKRILVAYCTNAGSTAEVAGAIAEALAGDGLEVDLKRFDEIDDLSAYSAVVVGGPMIIGLHRKAVRFLKKNRRSLSRVPVALFFTAMQITKTGGGNGYGFPILLDPRAARDPADPARLKFKEKHTTVGSYLRPIRRLLDSIQFVADAFFTGKLDYRQLGILQMLFVMLVIGARPGDFRDWELIRKWGREMRPLLMKNRDRLGSSNDTEQGEDR